MISKTRVSICLLFGLVLSAITIPVAHAATTTTKIEFTQVITNPCNGESVVITGTRNVVSGDTGNGFHVQVQIKGSGIGALTGAKYEAPSTSTTVVNSPGAFEATSVLQFKFVAQGKVPNFTHFENMHITVNANGDVTAMHSDFREECK